MDSCKSPYRYLTIFQIILMKISQLVALLAGFLVMLVNGSLYVYGTMTPYIITFLYYKGEKDLTISDLSIIQTMAIIFTNFGIFCSNFKILSFSNRVTSAISALGISLCMLILSFLHNFVFYVLIYGLLYGFFIGFGYMAPLKNCYDHLPNRKGLCSGTCLMGFGLGAFFFNFILVGVVNPDNQKQKDHLFPEDVGNRLPLALQILAIVYAAIGLLGVFLTWPAAKETDLAKPLVEQKDELEGHGHYSSFALKLASEKKLIYLLFVLATTVPFGIFVAFNYKQYGLYFIDDDHYLSILGSIGSVGNGVFRMFWGILMDILPFKQLKIIMIGLLMFTCATIVFAVKNEGTYLVTVLICYGTYGGLYSVYPTQTVKLLGRQLGPKLYYITFLGFTFGGILQYISHKFLVQEFGQKGYTYCFITFGIFLIISMILILFGKLQPSKQSDNVRPTVITQGQE